MEILGYETSLEELRWTALIGSIGLILVAILGTYSQNIISAIDARIYLQAVGVLATMLLLLGYLLQLDTMKEQIEHDRKKHTQQAVLNDIVTPTLENVNHNLERFEDPIHWDQIPTRQGVESPSEELRYLRPAENLDPGAIELLLETRPGLYERLMEHDEALEEMVTAAQEFLSETVDNSRLEMKFADWGITDRASRKKYLLHLLTDTRPSDDRDLAALWDNEFPRNHPDIKQTAVESSERIQQRKEEYFRTLEVTLEALTQARTEIQQLRSR